MSRSALLLFSHGSPDPEWAEPFVALQDLLAQRHAGIPVVLAYLAPARPAFEDVVAQLSHAGVKQVVVAPLFLARGGHVKRDLPALVRDAAAKYGMVFRILPTLGEVEALQMAIANWIGKSAAPDL